METPYNTEQTAEEEIISRASIAKHPIHPALIPFPIAFLVGMVLSDFVFITNNDPFWAQVSIWLNGAGVVSGIIAGIAGSIDFGSDSRIRRLTAAKIHLIGNIVALALALVNVGVRLPNPSEGVRPLGIVLSVVVALLLTITGWFGGEMVFKHKVGVSSQEPTQ
jgi:uncharacterized membrane protein